VTPPLNLPAPGRCQAIFVILTISHSHVFLVNSRLDHFSAPTSLWVPFSRSYGVNLPSSLAVIHSSALGFSPRPPVSVYGTGCCTLIATTIFSQVCFHDAIGSSVDSPYCRGSVALPRFNRLFRQTAVMSLLGLVVACTACSGILTASASHTPLGFCLAPGLP
jgi:hypothetical protein